MANTTDTRTSPRPARLSGADARAAADAARAARAAGRPTTGNARLANQNASAAGAYGTPASGAYGTPAAGAAPASGDRASRRASTRRERRAARVRDARVAPDHAADGREPEPRREAGSQRSIDVAAGLSRIGDFVIHFRRALLVAAIFVAFILTFYGPCKTYYKAWRAGLDLQDQLTDLNSSNDQYKSDIQSLQTREGIEDEARRRGYVSEGETKVVVEGLSDDADDSSSSTDAELPWYIQLGDKVFHYIGN